ncbi:MAG TPA: sulfotransferase [Acidimicrobiales bacterium]|nr:sulfotransferase [Acidimicrobiales bacterium]
MRERPILVVGIAQRSGTNFLADLLRCHPATSMARDPYREDFAFPRGDALGAWADGVADRLPARWGDAEWVRRDLRRALGEAVVRFLAATGDGAGRPVVKTPFAEALDTITALQAELDVVVVVRDAPAVIASMEAGFGAPLEWAAHTWRDGARRVLAWRDAISGTTRTALIVRYEDLKADRRGTLTPVLEHLRLDVGAMDWAAAEALPVRGSSYAPGGLDWSGQTGGEAPTGTRMGVSNPRRAAAITGAERAALGYAAPEQRRTTDTVLEWVWPARRAATQARRAISRVLLGTARPAIRAGKTRRSIR